MYKVLALGGTFDHFHKGHRVLLSEAFSLAEKVIIGVTSDKYAKSKDEKIESFKKRKYEMKKFLVAKNYIDKAEIVKIENPFGPTLSDKKIEAVLVSEATKGGAEQINKERNKKRMEPLIILVLSLVNSEDGKPISSSRIREGQIDREGTGFLSESWLKKGIVLSDQQKLELKKPLGRVLKAKKEIKRQSATVGDVVTKYFNEKGLNHNLSIIDFKVKRKKIHSSLSDLNFRDKLVEKTLKNSAGTISADAFRMISDFFKTGIQRSVFIVQGEEDLLVLPVILTAPLGFTVYYGQPKKGIVEVVVTEKKKREIRQFLRLEQDSRPLTNMVL